MWLEFTNTTFNKIKINKINKLFIKKIKSIRSEIINIKKVKYTYSIIQIPNNVIDTLKSSPWVSNKLSYDYLLYEVNIKWDNNNIYIKTTKDKFDSFLTRLPIFLKIFFTFINSPHTEFLAILNVVFIVNFANSQLDPLHFAFFIQDKISCLIYRN